MKIPQSLKYNEYHVLLKTYNSVLEFSMSMLNH